MAQVPGRCPSHSQKLSSDEYSPLNCQPCTTRGKTFPAESYCEECKEYLCQACCDYHSALKVLSQHRLSDISAAPVKEKRQQGSRPTINCKQHTDELIKFYCRKHNITACAVCAVKQHRQCDVDYLQDISFDFTESDQFKDFLSDLNTITIQVETFLQLTEDNDKKTAENAQKLLEILEHRRDEMVKFINKEIYELNAELKKLLQGDQNKLGQIKKDFKQYKKELDEANAFIEKLEGRSSDLLITCTDKLIRFQSIQDDLKKAKPDNRAYTYRFKTSDVSEDLLSSKNGLGTVIREEIPQTIQAQKPLRNKLEPRLSQKPRTGDQGRKIDWATCKPAPLPDFNVKSTQDQNTCNITDIEILDPNTLLITDRNNECIKRVDTYTAAITGYLKLPSKPLNMTLLEPGLAVTTLPGKHIIQFFSTKGDIALLHDIKVNGRCLGLSSTANCRLVVGYQNPGKVEVMDKRGAVLCEIRNGKDGLPLFKCSNYICVVNEGQQEVVYVSDWRTNTLTKLSLTGQVLFTYNEKGICTLGVTATGDGDGVLLCGGSSHNVQVVSERGEKIGTVLEEKDDVRNPWSVCYDASKNIMYVSSLPKDDIKVYQLK